MKSAKRTAVSSNRRVNMAAINTRIANSVARQSNVESPTSWRCHSSPLKLPAPTGPLPVTASTVRPVRSRHQHACLFIRRAAPGGAPAALSRWPGRRGDGHRCARPRAAPCSRHGSSRTALRRASVYAKAVRPASGQDASTNSNMEVNQWNQPGWNNWKQVCARCCA